MAENEDVLDQGTNILTRGFDLSEQVKRGKYDEQATQEQRDDVSNRIREVHSNAFKKVVNEGAKLGYTSLERDADNRLEPELQGSE